jgi:rhodanese-related sulfurtransferase
VPRTKPVLLICRSGKRTLDAAQVLESLGYKQVINVLHGVEGDPDASGVRGRINGWLAEGLPVRTVAAKAAQMVAASVT